MCCFVNAEFFSIMRIFRLHCFNLMHCSGFLLQFSTKTTVCMICRSGNDWATAMWQWLCHDSCCFHFSSRLIKGQRSRLRHRRPLIPWRPQPVSRLFRCTQKAVREPEWERLLLLSASLFALCDYSLQLLQPFGSRLGDKDIHLPDMKTLVHADPKWLFVDGGRKQGGKGGGKRW